MGNSDPLARICGSTCDGPCHGTVRNLQGGRKARAPITQHSVLDPLSANDQSIIKDCPIAPTADLRVLRSYMQIAFFRCAEDTVVFGNDDRIHGTKSPGPDIYFAPGRSMRKAGVRNL